MKVTFNIELGNEGMKTKEQAIDLIEYTLNNRDLRYIDSLKLRDINGNLVGNMIIEE